MKMKRSKTNSYINTNRIKIDSKNRLKPNGQIDLEIKFNKSQEELRLSVFNYKIIDEA